MGNAQKRSSMPDLLAYVYTRHTCVRNAERRVRHSKFSQKQRNWLFWVLLFGVSSLQASFVVLWESVVGKAKRATLNFGGKSLQVLGSSFRAHFSEARRLCVFGGKEWCQEREMARLLEWAPLFVSSIISGYAVSPLLFVSLICGVTSWCSECRSRAASGEPTIKLVEIDTV